MHHAEREAEERLDTGHNRTSVIIYEQPLNERIRGLLRIEFLFSAIATRLIGQSEWDSRAVLSCTIEVTDILSRYDIKADLIKELERHYALLVRLQTSPEVDAMRLNETISRLNRLLTTLKDPLCQPGQTFRRDELVNAIKQRSGIPGGTCNFDMPAYHYWLNCPAKVRIDQLNRWLEDLRIVEEGVAMTLKLVRESATPMDAIAPDGFYHRTLEPSGACSLIRIAIPREQGLFPEISAGKHRFTLRFMEQPNTSERPVQTNRDVKFELHLCALTP